MIEKLLISQLEKQAPKLIEKHKDKAAALLVDLLKELTLKHQYTDTPPGTRCLLYVETEPQNISVVVLSIVNGAPAISRILNKYSISQLCDMAAAALLDELKKDGVKRIAGKL